MNTTFDSEIIRVRVSLRKRIGVAIFSVSLIVFILVASSSFASASTYEPSGNYDQTSGSQSEAPIGGAILVIIVFYVIPKIFSKSSGSSNIQIKKKCSKCHKEVSILSRPGQHCPHCGHIGVMNNMAA